MHQFSDVAIPAAWLAHNSVADLSNAVLRTGSVRLARCLTAFHPKDAGLHPTPFLTFLSDHWVLQSGLATGSANLDVLSLRAPMLYIPKPDQDTGHAGAGG